MARNIQKIEQSTLPMPKLIRVAAYARVSSGKEAMLHSLSAQVSYYSALIQRNPQWRYIGVYAGEGITGTKTDRPEFRRLIEECRSDKIDMVITKSISRFARNTVAILETVRELNIQITCWGDGGEVMLNVILNAIIEYFLMGNN